MTGYLPKLYKLNLKYVNKKKKLKTKSFLKISCLIYKNLFFIFEDIFIRYFYFYIKSLQFIEKDNFDYTEEFLKKKLNYKVKISFNSICINFIIYKNFLNLSRTGFKFKCILNNKRLAKKTENYFYRLKYLSNIKLKLISSYIKYFLILIKLIFFNLYKINIFFYKKLSKRNFNNEKA